MRLLPVVAALCAAALPIVACSSEDDPSCTDHCGTGGLPTGTGGAPSNGGAASGTGGTTGTGSTSPATGGTSSGAGGGPSSGGAPSTGGVGSGGAHATGGASSGGAVATGGAATGGAATGGTVSTGGNAATGGTTATGGTSSGGAAPAFVMGAENKNGTQEQLEAPLQCDLNINQITTGWCNSWSSWEQTGCNVFAEVSAFHKADPKHAVELSLAPWPQAMSGQSWGACARGDYDAHYTNIAKSILSNGMTHVIIRLGYEWDGNWFPWGTGLHETGNVNNQGKGGTALEYGACFKRFDAAIQAVARAQSGVFFRTNMNPIHDTPGTKATQLQQVLDAAGGPRAKGGSVDFLGVDFYDYPARNNFESRMASAIAFAKKNAMPLSFPEWGLGGDSRTEPAVDDAGVIYLQKMRDTFADPANGVRYASYFNCSTSDCAGNHSLIPPNNPQSLQKFIELFGNGKLGCGANARAMIEKM